MFFFFHAECKNGWVFFFFFCYAAELRKAGGWKYLISR